jgi:protein AbiQ
MREAVNPTISGSEKRLGQPSFFFYIGANMKLKFYRVNSEYYDFLRQTDPCVPYIQGNKTTRPFVGVVLKIEELNYFAPLTSPKPKHRKMKNQTDFLKINNGEWGSINFNNMIPVHSSCLTLVDIKIAITDNKDEIAYKNLLSNQLSWCNKNRVRILSHASKL